MGEPTQENIMGKMLGLIEFIFLSAFKAKPLLQLRKRNLGTITAADVREESIASNKLLGYFKSLGINWMH